MNPKFPIYVVSKGRWEARLTVKSLERMNLPFYVIIDKKEYKEYAKVIDKKKLQR